MTIKVSCMRCGAEFTLGDGETICPAVPPDYVARFHIHRCIYRNGICPDCGRADERLSF